MKKATSLKAFNKHKRNVIHRIFGWHISLSITITFSLDQSLSKNFRQKCAKSDGTNTEVTNCPLVSFRGNKFAKFIKIEKERWYIMLFVLGKWRRRRVECCWFPQLQRKFFYIFFLNVKHWIANIHRVRNIINFASLRKVFKIFK